MRTTSIAESTLAERMGDAEAQIAPLTLAYLPGLGSVDLRATAWNLPPDDADRRLAAAAALLAERAGEHAYGRGDDDLAALVLAEARRRRLTLAVAESCTGGLLGGRLTAVPGSSSQFLGGVISYADGAKQGLLGVPEALLAAHGAVSGPGGAGDGGRGGARSRSGCGGLDHRHRRSRRRLEGKAGGHRLARLRRWRARLESMLRNTIGTREEIRGRAAQIALFELWRRLRHLPE